MARKLANSSLVVCASPEYLKIHGIPQDPEDLEDHSCLINWAIPPRNKWRFKGILGERTVTVTGRMQANMADPIRNAAVNGLGLIMLPRYIVGRDIELGRLKVVMEQYGISPLEVYAVYPHRKYLSAKVRSFLEFIQGWLPHQNRHGPALISLEAKWDAIYQRPTQEPQAAEVLRENRFLLPVSGRALDLACGLGGNALFMAAAGLNVDAWDISGTALQ